MRVVFTMVIALSGVLMACQPTPMGEHPPAQAEGQYGLVVLSHHFGTPGVAVSGQWMKYRGHEHTTALHALALPEQVWMLTAPPPEGRCRALVAGGELDALASIDLLDVGTLQVRAPSILAQPPLQLTPRALPPIGFFAVNGVIYDADAPEQLPYLAGERYAVQADGAETGPVQAEVAAAESVWLVSQTMVDDGLEISWGGAPQARVMIARDVGNQTMGVECSGTKHTALVPLEALAALGGGPAALTVSRVQRTAIQMSDFEHADLLFVAQDGRDIVIPEFVTPEAEEGPQR